MENIFEELSEQKEAIKDLYAKSVEIRAGISIKYLKHKLNEYLNSPEIA